MVEIMWFGILVGICGVCFMAIPVLLAPFAIAGGFIARHRRQRERRREALLKDVAVESPEPTVTPLTRPTVATNTPTTIPNSPMSGWTVGLAAA